MAQLLSLLIASTIVLNGLCQTQGNVTYSEGKDLPHCPIPDDTDYSKYMFFTLLFIAFLNMGWIIFKYYYNKNCKLDTTDNFIEFETWYIRKGVDKKKHDEIMRRWFKFVENNRSKLFKEWKSVKYYKEVNHDGIPTNKYVILFEFYTREQHHKYKNRRKDYSGPYKAYKEIDPYHLNVFDLDTGRFTEEYWQPQDTECWLY